MVWEYYNDKVIFMTGGTGFVGTALIYRILSQSSPKHIFVLSRGGFSNARAKWSKMLPPQIIKIFLDSSRMTVMDGELGDTATMSLSDEELQMLKRTVHIFIHAASSIMLNHSLRELSYTIVAPTLCLTQYALKFPNLERFVFLSSAYANSHLWTIDRSSDVSVEEEIYSLSAEYEAHDFPWPYAYAKHLAERLVMQKAAQEHALDKILIVRPSAVGPADEFPYPGFTTPFSTPSTACAAAVALHPGRKINLATRCENPDEEVTIDEVPVDVVADRVLVHVAQGTSGCVHAVSGEKGRLRFGDWWHAFKSERRLPWQVKPVWASDDWHSSDLHHMAKNFKIIGTSFAFKEGKTDRVAELLGPEQTKRLRLYADRSQPYSHSLVHRRHHIHRMAKQLAKKNKLPAFSVGLLCRKGKPLVQLEHAGA
ncbi:hypothetical protein N7468_000987 [Penicillium chermesinum]|uniref:Fatty acyl-CoA reductase n=1 Tax=Penicillium chermesinum TaxID=63820 RepID=A0A9W9PFQ6_9EURO|nr:uncharacterized protein N7468_000987 [Penicillium chermesinum]KAJ5246004.1 hypothetical protein N7468_000987 [Penicillium chermesinum]